jgi:ornithine carbamoyltransferase
MNLLRVLDLKHDELADVLDAAGAMKAAPRHWFGALDHQTMVALFARPSTRTRVAFAAAAQRLGVLPLFVDADVLQLSRGENVADTARSLSSYARLLVARLPSHGDLEELAAAATIPVVNALSDRHHPCEAIASLFTLREHFGRLDGLRLAYVGDGNNVAHSLVEASALAGLTVNVACPVGNMPDESVITEAQEVAARTGGDVVVAEDPRRAVRGADAVFTDVWGQPDIDAGERLRRFADYRVDKELMSSAAERAVFIHCLPARRGEEVTADVIDGPRSLVWAQVANHLYVAQAVIWSLS